MNSNFHWLRLVLIAFAVLVCSPLVKADTITCSSDDMHRHTCRAKTWGGVELVKQRSDAECREGYSWGYDREGIWVDRGCRAEFRVLEARIVTCSSDDMRRHYCEIGGGGDARLHKQHSDAECREGYSWGVDRRGLWVDHGCRAEFEVSARRDRWQGNGGHGENNGYGDNGSNGQVVSCSSDDMHRNYCQADTRAGVRLVKQHSDTECREGYSWGYDRGGIWVDRGCRADFQTGR